METRKSLGMLDKLFELFEALSSIEENINKIISFLKHIDKYNLMSSFRKTIVFNHMEH